MNKSSGERHSPYNCLHGHTPAEMPGAYSQAALNRIRAGTERTPYSSLRTGTDSPDAYHAGMGDVPKFTVRQREVLQLIGEGRTTVEIAERLGITPATATAYVVEVVNVVRQRGRVEQGDPEWPLSRRESQVAALLAAGKSDQEIADELRVGLRTAEDHTHRVLKKLGKRSRQELIKPPVSARRDNH